MLNVGIVVPGERSGGVRQSAFSIAEALRVDGIRVNLFAQDSMDSTRYPREFHSGPTLSTGWRRFIRYSTLSAGYTDRDGLAFEANARATGVEMLIYPTPVACSPPRSIPFAVVIPDLMHRYYPALPEYRWPKMLARDIVYRRYAQEAARVVVDSDHGAADAVRFLGIAPQRCVVIPYMPAPTIFRLRHMPSERAATMVSRLQLPKKFLLYPAQLWRHKNHRRLIRAIEYAKRRFHVEINLVCAGFTNGIYEKEATVLRQTARRLGIDSHIHFTGYVTAEELAALYRLSSGLVFPTLIGPTSIPPLEALLMGTPVACSRLFSMPGQIGDAGLYFDPFSIEDIADKITTLWLREDVVARLRCNGRRRAEELHQRVDQRQWVALTDAMICKAAPVSI